VRGGAPILVVDDDAAVREAVCVILSELGYLTEGASGGDEALGRFRPGRYRLVITDLAMPRMNGLELARRLRALEPALPILIFSGHGGWTDGPPGLTGVAVARKPDVDTLARLVQRALCPS
jgi:CheY-like chemotaxis protein